MTVPRAASENEIVAYHVTVRHRPGPPGVSGTWADGAVAERKFTSFVGRYGTSSSEVRIELLEETADGVRTVVRTWPPEASGR